MKHWKYHMSKLVRNTSRHNYLDCIIDEHTEVKMNTTLLVFPVASNTETFKEKFQSFLNECKLDLKLTDIEKFEYSLTTDVMYIILKGSDVASYRVPMSLSATQHGRVALAALLKNSTSSKGSK